LQVASQGSWHLTVHCRNRQLVFPGHAVWLDFNLPLEQSLAARGESPGKDNTMDDNLKQARIDREQKLMDRWGDAIAEAIEPEQFPIKVKRRQIKWQGAYGVELKGGRFLLLENIEIVD
jgi:hypothetical protein